MLQGADQNVGVADEIHRINPLFLSVWLWIDIGNEALNGHICSIHQQSLPQGEKASLALPRGMKI